MILTTCFPYSLHYLKNSVRKNSRNTPTQLPLVGLLSRRTSLFERCSEACKDTSFD